MTATPAPMIATSATSSDNPATVTVTPAANDCSASYDASTCASWPAAQAELAEHRSFLRCSAGRNMFKFALADAEFVQPCELALVFMLFRLTKITL